VLVQGCKIKKAMIGEGCFIKPGSKVTNSIIGLRTHVGANCVIEDCLIMGADFYETAEDCDTTESCVPMGIGAGSCAPPHTSSPAMPCLADFINERLSLPLVWHSTAAFAWACCACTLPSACICNGQMTAADARAAGVQDAPQVHRRQERAHRGERGAREQEQRGEQHRLCRQGLHREGRHHRRHEGRCSASRLRVLSTTVAVKDGIVVVMKVGAVPAGFEY
jgi:hypothetical protein